MNRENIWAILDIAPTHNKREIRKAYAMQAKSCHPEEDEKAFVQLKDAYQRALQYAEEKPDRTERSEKLKRQDSNQAKDETAVEKRENSLLSRLSQAEKETMQRGALHELIQLLADPKKSKRSDCWRDYFLSESFLKEQFDEPFGRGLMQYLEESDQMLCNTDSAKMFPPRPFIIELAIAYGLQPDADGAVNGEGSFYNRAVAGRLWNRYRVNWHFPIEVSSEKKLNPNDFRVQDNPELMAKFERSLISGPERMLMRTENLVRLRSFSDYLMLRNMNRQGYLTEKEKKIWEPILDGGCSRNLYEKNGRNEVYLETRSICFLVLCANWIRMETVPLCVCQYLYQKYGLRNLEHSSVHQLYVLLKTAILKQYPNIEEDLFDQGSKEQMIRSWYQELMQIISDYHSCYDRREYAEPDAIRDRIEALFQHKEWKKIQHEPELFDRMYRQIAQRKVMPRSLAEKLCAFYQEVYPWPEPQQVQKMQEGLIISMSFHRNLLEQDYRYPYIYGRTEISDIDTKNRDFWEYFLMIGFGSRYYSDVTSCQRQARYVIGNNWYLPAYMEAVYMPSMGWRKKFTGFDEEKNAVLSPKSLIFFLPHGQVFKVEFHLWYIRFILDDTPIIYPAFTFPELLEMTDKTEMFFFLLAVTAIADEEREMAEKEILAKLEELPFAPATLPILAKMIAADNARSPIPENEKRRIQAVFYEEQKRFCFKAEVYLRSVKTYRRTNFGWVELALLDGEGKEAKALDLEGKKQYAVWKLLSLRQPEPVLLSSYSLEGLSNQAKMRRIIDALKEQEQYRKNRMNLYVPGFPWSPEEITPAVRRFFAEDGGWMLESYVLLQMGTQKNASFERIFYSKMNIFGFDLFFQSPEFSSTLNARTDALSRKIREKHLIVGHFGWGKSYEARQSYAPMPFAVGESGRFYAYDFLHLYQAETLEGLMDQLFDFSEVSRVDVYKGKLSVSRFDHELEYCYTKEDFDEYLHSKKKTLPDIFTKFGI